MYQIISDGSCDLDPKLAQELGVKIVPFYITTDGVTHKKEIEEVGIRDFYQFLIDNPKVFPKTSMPSIQDYLNVFEPILKMGDDIICLCITTKFSGSFNSANNAKQMLEEEYPDRKITVIDTTLNTVLEGLIVEQAALAKKNGITYQEVIDKVETIKNTGRILFTVGTMDYLIHGGRVGKVSGAAAGALNLKPLICMKEGEIFSGGIARGRKKSISKVIEQIVNHFVDNDIDPNTYTITVGFGYDEDEAYVFRDKVISALKDKYLDYNQDIPVRQIGATISVHTGPYPLGVGLLKKI